MTKFERQVRPLMGQLIISKRQKIARCTLETPIGHQKINSLKKWGEEWVLTHPSVRGLLMSYKTKRSVLKKEMKTYMDVIVDK